MSSLDKPRMFIFSFDIIMIKPEIWHMVELRLFPYKCTRAHDNGLWLFELSSIRLYITKPPTSQVSLKEIQVCSYPIQSFTTWLGYKEIHVNSLHFISYYIKNPLNICPVTSIRTRFIEHSSNFSSMIRVWQLNGQYLGFR